MPTRSSAQLGWPPQPWALKPAPMTQGCAGQRHEDLVPVSPTAAAVTRCAVGVGRTGPVVVHPVVDGFERTAHPAGQLAPHSRNGKPDGGDGSSPVAAPTPAAWSRAVAMELSAGSPRTMRSKLVATKELLLRRETGPVRRQRQPGSASARRPLSMAVSVVDVHPRGVVVAARRTAVRKSGCGAMLVGGLAGGRMAWPGVATAACTGAGGGGATWTGGVVVVGVVVAAVSSSSVVVAAVRRRRQRTSIGRHWTPVGPAPPSATNGVAFFVTDGEPLVVSTTTSATNATMTTTHPNRNHAGRGPAFVSAVSR